MLRARVAPTTLLAAWARLAAQILSARFCSQAKTMDSQIVEMGKTIQFAHGWSG